MLERFFRRSQVCLDAVAHLWMAFIKTHKIKRISDRLLNAARCRILDELQNALLLSLRHVSEFSDNLDLSLKVWSHGGILA